MASPHFVLRRVPLAGLAAATVFCMLPAATSHADPKVTAAAAAAQLQTLNTKAEILSEKYDAVQDQLSAAQLRLSADQHQVTAQQAQVDAARRVVATVAVAAYTSGRLDDVTSLIGESDPTVALRRAAILGLLSDHQNQTLKTAIGADQRLQQAQITSKQQLSSIAALQTSLKAQQKVLNGYVVQQTALLKASQAQEQSQAAQAAANVASQEREVADRVNRSRVRPAISRTPTRQAPRRRSTPVAAPVYSGGGSAAAALRYAYAQLGKSYRYGAAGAATFDCSGLTMRAWAAAGVSMSHNAAAQYDSTPHVSRANLQPGDLVYFGFPIHHVGIYIGGGKMIEAPYTGADVRITSFGYRSDYAGASRP